MNTSKTNDYPRFAVVTWPESQDFVGHPDCILILPPENEADPTALDSSYFVPESIAGPLDAGEAYLRIPFPQSQRWDDIELTQEESDAVLHDYDSQDVYVQEEFYNRTSPVI